ncbi:MAG: MFS transporter [Thermoplasmata archaeon]
MATREAAPTSGTGAVSAWSPPSDPAKQRRNAIIIVILAFLGWMMVWTDGNLVLIMYPDVMPHVYSSFPSYLWVPMFSGMLFISFLAAWIGSLIIGPLMDRYGRRALFQITILGTAIFSGFQYFITSFWNWTGLRSVDQLLNNSEWSVGGTMVTETVSTRMRGIALAIMQSGFVAGYATAALIVYYVLPAFPANVGFRVAFLVSVFPAIVIAIARYWVRDPPRYEAIRALKRAQKANDPATIVAIEKVYPTDQLRATKFTYVQILSRDQVRKSVSLAFWSFMLAGIGIALLTFMPLYIEFFKGITYTGITGLYAIALYATIPAYLVNGFIADYIGAKYSALLFAAIEVIGIMVFISPSIHGYYPTFFSFLLFSWGLNGAFASTIRMNTESFPTRARGTGSGWVNAWYSFGFAIWPVIFGGFAIPMFAGTNFFVNYSGALNFVTLSASQWGTVFTWYAAFPMVITIIVCWLGIPYVRGRAALEEIST